MQANLFMGGGQCTFVIDLCNIRGLGYLIVMMENSVTCNTCWCTEKKETNKQRKKVRKKLRQKFKISAMHWPNCIPVWGLWCQKEIYGAYFPGIEVAQTYPKPCGTSTHIKACFFIFLLVMGKKLTVPWTTKINQKWCEHLQNKLLGMHASQILNLPPADIFSPSNKLLGWKFPSETCPKNVFVHRYFCMSPTVSY